MNKEFILVIDDEEDLLEIYKSRLQRHGFKVTTAKNGREAIEQIKSAQPLFDLILCDINMPEINGIGVYKFTRSHAQSAKPFIFITGHAKGSPELEEVEKSGAIVLNKPVDFTELVNLIKKL